MLGTRAAHRQGQRQERLPAIVSLSGVVCKAVERVQYLNLNESFFIIILLNTFCQFLAKMARQFVLFFFFLVGSEKATLETLIHPHPNPLT